MGIKLGATAISGVKISNTISPANYYGVSTDIKPTNANLYDLFLELDTKTLYYCAKRGSQSEEVVFDGELYQSSPEDAEESQIPIVPNVTSLGDTITVVFDGTTYTCEQKGDALSTYYGATMTVEGLSEGDSLATIVYDWSEYPFNLVVENGRTYYQFKDSGTHSLSISSLVTTEAVWTKYGEGGSGEMINVYYLHLGQEITELTSQVAKGESITIPDYSLGTGTTEFIPFRVDGTDLAGSYQSGDTFIPTDEYIYTEVPSRFPVSDATVPFVAFNVLESES